MLFLCILPATFTVHAQPRVLVVYHSQTGKTKAMAEAVARGAKPLPDRQAGTIVILKIVSEATTADVLAADAIIVGSPVHNANVAPEVQAFINRWPFEGSPLKDKIGAAFVTGGGISAGEELVQVNILHSMLVFGMVVVGGSEWSGAFGASAITGEPPFDSKTVEDRFLKKAEALGKRVAEIAARMKR